MRCPDPEPLGDQDCEWDRWREGLLVASANRASPPTRQWLRTLRYLVRSGTAVYTPQPFCAGIAQLVERVIRNDEVVGSIPISGTTRFCMAPGAICWPTWAERAP